MTHVNQGTRIDKKTRCPFPGSVLRENARVSLELLLFLTLFVADAIAACHGNTIAHADR